VEDVDKADNEILELGGNENTVGNNDTLHSALKKLRTFYNVTIPSANDEIFDQAEVVFRERGEATNNGYNEPDNVKQE
jgi:hypothetical protein